MCQNKIKMLIHESMFCNSIVTFEDSEKYMKVLAS